MKTNEPTCHVLLALLTLWLPWIITLIAAQSAAPKLMWCASPLTPAVLESPIDTWVDVPDTSVAVKLQNEAVVMISYDVSVTHVTDVQPEGVQVSELNELSFRIAVDGTPYRQSATTVDDREPIVVVASGFLVLEIPRGHHLVKLQWRKRGTHVLKWAVASDILDGFAGGRSLTVSAQHRFIWYKQPITAVSLLSLNKWEAVPGMAVNFRLSEPATIRFFYQLPVRPELVQYSRDTAAYDEIETALEINGLRYRETGSYGIVEGSRKGGTMLLLEGDDFSEQMQFTCIFNSDIVVLAEWHNATHVSCITPSDSHEQGFATLAISDVNNNFQVELQRKFRSLAAIFILAVPS
ncbi:hypothetical protein JG687_00004349 [Phytophthora cactorum]|uniref:IPT/TIG domain-containing protein n=1 Tax=Phytophthora cactorum TaxID=29920 RepID=A0A8T1UTH7_9STRA|nr:hypothetical protein JG687_00004349 [Phytophthora cactorum]